MTSGVITTLGLVVGLYAGTHSELAVIGGIVTIAIADALSDALGIHVSEESRGGGGAEVWESTAATFVFKFVVALSFLVPLLTLPVETAISVSVAWGLGLVALLSYYIAREERPWMAVAEHLTITVVVIVATHLVGRFVALKLA
jgi:hypothetical protein